MISAVNALRFTHRGACGGGAVTPCPSKGEFTNVARASQEELLEDYRDFMRARKIEEWTPDHRYAQRLRRLNRAPGGKGGRA